MFTRLAFDPMDKLPVKLSSCARRWRLLNAWTNVARKSALVPSNVTPDAVLSLRAGVSRITVTMMNVMTINYSGFSSSYWKIIFEISRYNFIFFNFCPDKLLLDIDIMKCKREKLTSDE